MALLIEGDKNFINVIHRYDDVTFGFNEAGVLRPTGLEGVSFRFLRDRLTFIPINGASFMFPDEQNIPKKTVDKKFGRITFELKNNQSLKVIETGRPDVIITRVTR